MNESRITALILARMTSSRLPGKGLMDLAGKPLLWHIVERLRRVHSLTEIALATTSQEADRPLLDFADMVNITSFAYDGEVDDVVGRIVSAADFFDSDVVVTISGDCPLIDPDFIELMVRSLLASGKEAVGIDKNKHLCLHEGIGVMTRSAWQKLDRASTEPYQREHAGIYAKEHPGFLSTTFVVPEHIFQRNGYRLSVDNLADLKFMREVYRRLYRPGGIIDLREVIHLLDDEPHIYHINSHVMQKGILQTSKRVVFVLDAGKTIGMGHLRRCLALAKELHEAHHCGIRFIANDDHTTAALLDRHGFACRTVDGSVLAQQNRQTLLTEAQSFKADAVVIDCKPDIPAELIQDLEANSMKTVVLDNLSSGSSFADLIVLPVAHSIDKNSMPTGRADVIQGAPYVLMHHEFTAITPRTSGQIKPVPDIVVSIGGSDPNQVTARVLDALQGMAPRVKLTAVLGPYNGNAHTLPKLPALQILHNVTNMADVLAGADLAILGYGITVYEAAFLGIPSLVITHTRQDAVGAERLCEQGICRSLGYWQDVTPEAIVLEVQRLLVDQDLRTRMVESARSLLDGRGVERVAKKVMTILA